MADLVGNPADRFSHCAAHIVLRCQTEKTKSAIACVRFILRCENTGNYDIFLIFLKFVCFMKLIFYLFCVCKQMNIVMGRILKFHHSEFESRNYFRGNQFTDLLTLIKN